MPTVELFRVVEGSWSGAAEPRELATGIRKGPAVALARAHLRRQLMGLPDDRLTLEPFPDGSVSVEIDTRSGRVDTFCLVHPVRT